MTDFGMIKFSCPCLENFSSSFNAVSQSLPPDMKKHLVAILKDYFVRFGIKGAYVRLNDRTVSQIIAEHQLKEQAKPLTSGEADGTRWALYDPPSLPATEGASKPDE